MHVCMLIFLLAAEKRLDSGASSLLLRMPTSLSQIFIANFEKKTIFSRELYNFQNGKFQRNKMEEKKLYLYIQYFFYESSITSF